MQKLKFTTLQVRKNSALTASWFWVFYTEYGVARIGAQDIAQRQLGRLGCEAQVYYSALSSAG
jgi:hypothetical protein